MKNLILAAPLAVAAALVQIQPVAACALSNDVMDSHSVLMSAAMLIFALAATVTAFTANPRPATANPLMAELTEANPQVFPSGSGC